MDSHPQKRQHPPGDGSPSKKTKLSGGDGGITKGGKMTFAQRMMAKMGHQEGTGLGREAQGIVNPIQVKLRPQGAGVGAVNEKVPDPREKKPEKGRRGEKKTLEKSHDSASSTPRRPVPTKKVRTTVEIEAEGLEIPDVFKNLIDMTGGFTAATSQSTPSILAVSEELNMKTRAQRELEAYADAWTGLKERKEHLVMQDVPLQRELDQVQAEFNRSKELADAVSSLAKLDINASSMVTQTDDILPLLELVVERLEHFQSLYTDKLDTYGLHEVAVAAICPLVRKYVSVWDPLQHDETSLVPFFKRVSAILGVHNTELAGFDQYDDLDVEQIHRTATPYESMVYTIWLPSVRSSVTNDWDVYDATSMVSLISEWKEVLPRFVYDIVVNQLVVQRLSAALKSWKPIVGPENKTGHPEAHLWIFPWLEYLDDYHLDPKSANGLLSEVKRKFRTAFDRLHPEKDSLESLDRWCHVKSLRGEINRDMEYRLLPTLANYLGGKLEINPADQDVTPFEYVMTYQGVFKPEKFSRVFLDAFFPKWLQTLQWWLVSDPNYYEISQWFSWWQSQFPEKINDIFEVEDGWSRGAAIVHKALDVGSDGLGEGLPLAAKATPQRSERRSNGDYEEAKKPNRSKPPEAFEPPSLKDLLEELCDSEGLLMRPLRQAHTETGQPLFRISASATGAGGVLVYTKGDLLWVQDKRDRSIWSVFDPFETGALVTLVEG